MFNRRKVMQLAVGALAGGLAPAQATPLGDLAARLGRPLRVLVPDGSQANVRSVIENFKAAHGCKVEMIVSDLDDINATLMLEALLPELGIDVALPATFGIPDLSEAGAILPLDRFAAEQGISSPGGIGDRFDDRLWGFQTDGDVYLMFYNRDMLEDPQHGAHYADTTGTPLAIPLTWEELDRQMAFFHRPEQGRYGGCLYRTAAYATWEWWARLHARGGRPFDDDCGADLANDAGIGALEAMIAASQHQTGAELGMFDNWKRYDRGDIYADIGWGGTQKALHRTGANMRGRIANGPLPGGPPARFPISTGAGAMSSPGIAARRPLAYGFCDFAVSKGPSADAVAAVDGYFDPFRPEHYDDPRIVEVYGAPFLKEHRKAMARPIPDLYIGRRQEYWDSLTMWLLRSLEGHVDPATALRNVADRWDSITERVSPEQQRARWHALRATYPRL